MNFNSLTVVISLLLAVFALYREYRRTDKAHLLWRILIVLIAIIALACIYLPVSYNTKAHKQAGTSNILLTEGYNKDSLQSDTKIYTLDKDIHRQYPKARLLYSLDTLFTDTGNNGALHVFGYGFDEDGIKELNGKPIIFHPSRIPDGFVAANWTGNIKAGGQLQVHGTYKNTSAKSYTLLLKGLNTMLDSVDISASGNIPFSLTTTPKQSGRTVYSLIAVSGKDTLQQEQLPVTITPIQPLSLLLLSASPDFETKFLREWLGSNGYSVASRSSITKGKFGQDYMNMNQPDLTHITGALLNKFDIVIGDLSVLKSLSPPENSALQQEVSQKGMGLIIRADSADKKASWLQSNSPLSYQPGKPQVPSALLLQNKDKTAKLNIGTEYITAQNNTQQLIADEHQHLMAGAALNGAGKLIFTTINNTYSWMLAGNKKDYAALWSLLIDKAARKLPEIIQWSVASSLPAINKPVKLMVESELPLAGVKINGTDCYPAQNPAAPFQQTYTYYPDKYGWQQAIPSNGTSFWWYVWQKNSWTSINAAKNIALTNSYIKNNTLTAHLSEKTQQKISKNVPKLYFYILFLMAVSFLWIESKFFST